MMAAEDADGDWDMPTAVVVVAVAVVVVGEVVLDWVTDGRDAFGILDEGGSY
jgi:hypothetical protein